MNSTTDDDDGGFASAMMIDDDDDFGRLSVFTKRVVNRDVLTLIILKVFSFSIFFLLQSSPPPPPFSSLFFSFFESRHSRIGLSSYSWDLFV